MRQWLHRIYAIWRRIAFDEYADRLSRSEVREAVRRGEDELGLAHKEWGVVRASRDEFELQAIDGSWATVDRSNGKFNEHGFWPPKAH